LANGEADGRTAARGVGSQLSCTLPLRTAALAGRCGLSARRGALTVRAAVTDVSKVPNLAKLATVPVTTPVGDLVTPLATGKPLVLHLLRRFG
jgi:hypothetical protein